MAVKTGNTYVSGTVTDSVEIPTANPGFSTTASSKKVSHRRLLQRPTTKNSNIAVLNANLVISGCPSLSQSLGHTFSEISMIESLRFAVGISMLSLIVSDI